MSNTSLKKIARFISTIFIPPTFALIIFITIGFQFEKSSLQTFLIILFTVLFFVVIPISYFMIMVRRGKIVNQDAEIKEERNTPYLLGVAIQIIGFIFLLIFNLSYYSLSLWLCYITNTLLIYLINRNWKISAHTTGAAVSAAFFLFFFGWELFLIFFIITFIVGSSRIILKVHTVKQVIAGGIFGFVVTYLQIYLYLNLFSENKLIKLF